MSMNTQKANKFFKVILYFCVISQFIQLGSIAYSISSSKSIIAANDDDAAVAIGVAYKSNWYNDNTFRAYGNFYYRVAKTLHWIAPILDDNKNLSKRGSIERSLHFYLIILNILSLYLALFLIAQAITNKREVQLTFLFIITNILLQNSTWSRFVLRPHPEIFFSGMLLISMQLISLHFQFKKNILFFKISGIMWGITTATKLTSLAFAPAVLLSLYENKETFLKKSLQYFKWCCIGYFVIGFPQNFIIHKTINAFLSMKIYSKPTTLSSIYDWLIIFKEQLTFPLLITILFILIFKSPDKPHSLKKLYIFLIVPPILLVTKNTTLLHNHYPISFILSILFILAILIKSTPITIQVSKHSAPICLVLVLITRVFAGVLPERVAETKKTLSSCRNEIMEVLNLAAPYLSSKKRVLTDPYTPIDDYKKQQFIRKTWNHTPDEITQKTSLIVLNSSYYGRYVNNPEPSDYVRSDIPNWKDVQKYYLLFSKKSSFEDRFQNVWIKRFDKCGIEVWSKS